MSWTTSKPGISQGYRSPAVAVLHQHDQPGAGVDHLPERRPAVAVRRVDVRHQPGRLERRPRCRPGVTSSCTNSVTTSRGCSSSQSFIVAQARHPGRRPELAHRVAQVGPDISARRQADSPADPQRGADRPGAEVRLRLRECHLAALVGGRDDAAAVGALAVPGVDQQHPDPVVELRDDPVGLLGEEPPRLVGRGHRVVGCCVGDLVVRPVAELDVPVAAVGGRWFGVVVRAAREQQPEADDQGDEPTHGNSVASAEQCAQRQCADRQPVPVVVARTSHAARGARVVLDR